MGLQREGTYTLFLKWQSHVFFNMKFLQGLYKKQNLPGGFHKPK